MSAAEELARHLGARVGALDASKLVPMMCEREEAGARVLEREGWLFELKLDGVRILADKRGGAVRLFYRKLRETTDSYGEVAQALATLADERVVLDGEIVAFDEQGRPDFQLLAHRIQTGAARRGAVPVVYVVFDVLAVGDYDLRGFPLEARKEVLSRIVPPEGVAGGLVRLHPTFEDGVALFRLCRERHLEGVVAKRRGTSYRPGERTGDWLKIKCERDAEFVVIGWTEGESDRARLGALDLGAYEGHRLVFRGRVGSGLHARMIDALLERLVPLEVAQPVAQGKYSPKPRRHHCRPEIVVSVRYGGWSLDPTGARFLRFPVFRGVRADVAPEDCTAAPEDDGRVAARTSAEVRRIHVSAPAQAVFADGTTKGALCTYFEAVAPALLAAARGRACALLRPDGGALWPPPKWTPKFVRTTTLKAAGKEVRGFVVDAVDALLFAVEAGSPCIHHRPLREDRPDVVDFVALRLSGAGVAAAAHRVRALAERIGLPAAAMSSGPGALDVLIGIGEAPAALAAPLGALIARLVEEDAAAGAAVERVEVARTPFAPCPGPRIAVALPLAWDELDAFDLGGADLDRARAYTERGTDPLASIAPARVTKDVAAVASALEAIVAERARRR